MSSSSPPVSQESKANAQSTPNIDAAARNPSYPQRAHLGEKKELEETLLSWDQKIDELARKFSSLGTDSRREDYERLYHQMLGARDQMAETVRRLPLETGDLYDEDHERFESARSALERLVQRWDAIGP